MRELNNEMLRQRYAVNNAGSSIGGLKFSEICGKKEELTFETKAFCCRRRHFPISKVLNEKIYFGKYLRSVQSF